MKIALSIVLLSTSIICYSQSKKDFKESELSNRFENSISKKEDGNILNVWTKDQIIKTAICLKKNYKIPFKSHPEFLKENEFYKNKNDRENKEVNTNSKMWQTYYLSEGEKQFPKCFKES
ncbi:hypothetical protein [Chryseobacterium defluvii]|uniref:Uncharacterized protein n=1 Tax=Chryseobacterium defluvii TaxID=160396 RepID=A0A495SE03_9FLAO|nr:hypothetical protein [Chryseobacterium defluvii]RKS98235.1 hypothetical protein BCF58_2376 [Chryseobacterium defluvii]